MWNFNKETYLICTLSSGPFQKSEIISVKNMQGLQIRIQRETYPFLFFYQKTMKYAENGAVYYLLYILLSLYFYCILPKIVIFIFQLIFQPLSVCESESRGLFHRSISMGMNGVPWPDSKILNSKKRNSAICDPNSGKSFSYKFCSFHWFKLKVFLISSIGRSIYLSWG